MLRLVSHLNKRIDTPFKWLTTQTHAAVKYSSTSAAATAEDKSSVEQLQQIFDDDKKSGGTVSPAKFSRLRDPNTGFLTKIC